MRRLRALLRAQAGRRGRRPSALHQCRLPVVGHPALPMPRLFPPPPQSTGLHLPLRRQPARNRPLAAGDLRLSPAAGGQALTRLAPAEIRYPAQRTGSRHLGMRPGGRRSPCGCIGAAYRRLDPLASTPATGLRAPKSQARRPDAQSRGPAALLSSYPPVKALNLATVRSKKPSSRSCSCSALPGCCSAFVSSPPNIPSSQAMARSHQLGSWSGCLP
jgi:hypothetical protein